MISIAKILSFFKSKWFSYGVLIAIIIALCFLVYLLFNQVGRLKTDNKRLKSNEKIWFASAEKYKDNYGKEVTKVQRLKISVTELEVDNRDLYKIIYDQANANDFKIKNLERALFISNKIVDSLRGIGVDSTFVFLNDTTTKQAYFDDGYLKSDVYWFISGPPLNIYTYNDSLYSFDYKQRRKWDFNIFKKRLFSTRIFGKWEYWSDGKWANPKNKIVALRKMEFIKRKRRK